MNQHLKPEVSNYVYEKWKELIRIELLKKKEFASYLAGLIDSKGIIKVHSKNEVNENPKIIIRLAKTETQLIHSIKKILDIKSPIISKESIIIEKVFNYLDLEITDINQIILIINLIKDELRTQKIGEINNLIKNINKYIPYLKKENIKILNTQKWIFIKNFNKEDIKLIEDLKKIKCIEYPFPNKKEVKSIKNILITDWLRGFIDTKGVFLKKEYKVSLTSEVKDGINNKFVMESLCKVFKSNYYLEEKKKMYHLEIKTKESKQILIGYLETHKLLTDKYRPYWDFVKENSRIKP
uniref:Homing endonuclease LAGLIDADG domain-containing protein n=1 Tax=Mitosporidium daphniae TaxID=1485682 RepID=A0A8F1NN62_9MICR|nr:hypothetical protein [Mitosporidium daphniae]